MPEYHPGTEIEIVDSIPTSGFRCALRNPKRYMKPNAKTLQDVGTAAYEGDLNLLEELLQTGDENNLFNGDLNAHITSLTALQMAAMSGQLECVDLLLRAKADPHMKECVAYGEDPEEGKTALDLAKEYGWDDTADMLESEEKKYPYGWYIPVGPKNNAKCYNCFEWGKKPPKNWFFSRPGAAKQQGLDPKKYGFPEEAEVEVDLEDIAPVATSVAIVEKALPIGLLFPGVGSQYEKMLEIVKKIPRVQEYNEIAKGILGYDLIELCSRPALEIGDPLKAPCVMFLACMAGVEKLKGENLEAVTRCQAVAGMSDGEFVALCVANVFTFEEGLKLVKKRAEAVNKTRESKPQATLSIAGLDKPKVAELCVEAQKKAGGGCCQIAQELFPKGFSVAGTETAINMLKDLADKAGALQAKKLANLGAIHTSVMKDAQDELSKAIDEMLPKMKPPDRTIYMNCTAQPVKAGTPPKEIAELMKKHISNTVLWESSVRAMIRDGISEFHEVGPMKQLKAMMKRIDPKTWSSTYNVEV